MILYDGAYGTCTEGGQHKIKHTYINITSAFHGASLL